MAYLFQLTGHKLCIKFYTVNNERTQALGRKPLGNERVAVLLTPEQVEWLKRTAEDRRTTVSQVLRDFLMEHMEAAPAKDPRSVRLSAALPAQNQQPNPLNE